jgi:hypothetical protein
MLNEEVSREERFPFKWENLSETIRQDYKPMRTEGPKNKTFVHSGREAEGNRITCFEEG